MNTTDTTIQAPIAAPHFHYRENALFVEQLSIKELAKSHGTPLFIYSKAALKEAWDRYQEAIADRDVLICYAMKANSNLAILNLFAQWGAGFDIVSGGELARALKAGANPQKIIFSGVGKQAWEIQAALEANIKCFNVESIPELDLIQEVASSINKKAAISLRVNPDVDAKTHPYISTGLKDNKFGIAMEDALATYERALSLSHIEIVGLDCHIGSQITDISPYHDALERLLTLMDQLRDKGITLHHLDIGGGLGIRYQDEEQPHPRDLINPTLEALQARGYGNLQLALEPGRSLVGNSGILVTEALFLKPGESKNFAIVDAAMNDLIRPTLYDAYHGALAVEQRQGTGTNYDIVGPVCETGDWLAKDRQFELEAGDLLAIESTGAYGFVMSSQYNSRPRAAELLVDGNKSYVIRRRETIEELFEHESIPADI
ncbi:MAG: diaminopimelate decarboxylase [Alcaligenaceae bacterium]|jgi:diaminopimelate decarboxylase|nr:diaminopimelate decarboxylase [Alcaligenaceae bacterium]